MEGRISGNDYSLNAVVSAEGDEEWQEWLVDEDADHEIKIAEQEEVRKRKELLSKAINVLNDREKNIIHYRKLSETPKTLEELSKEYDGKAVVGKVDVDSNQEFAAKFGVRNIPTVLTFKDGELVNRQVGVSSKNAYAENLDGLL